VTTERSHGGDPNREVFAIEREAARACRDYHERFLIGPTFRDRRAALAEFAATFYQERLRVPLGARTRATMSLLADPDTLILEMAHDGQLPHLGITRLVLKAHDVASQDRQAVTLYLVGNHYTPAMRPDNIRFGMPLKGEPPDAVKHPPKIKIGKANAQTPFRWLPPPESDDLAALRDQVRDFVSNNLAHEAKVGQSPTVGAAETAEARLSSVCSTTCLSDCCPGRRTESCSSQWQT
jgi:hypothetical protein